MVRAGSARAGGVAAHHIVAHGADAADEARAILSHFNININDAVNGVFLNAAQHAKMHTAAYYKAVTEMLRGAQTRQEALEILQRIRDLLLAGKFP
jgi:hypothetical protein